MDGEEIRLIDNSNNLLDAETVSWIAPPEVALVYPYTSQASGTIEYFNLFSQVCYTDCLFDTCVEGCGILKGGFTIEWWDEDEYLPDMSVFDDPCFTIATSSGTFADDFRYGFECGGAKLIHWAISPSDETWVAYTNEYRSLANNFPVNILLNTRSALQQGNSTTTTQFFPLLSATGSVMTYAIDLDNIADSDNYFIVAEFKRYLNIILYFTLLLYVFYRVVTVVTGGVDLPERQINPEWIKQQEKIKAFKNRPSLLQQKINKRFK